jgi:hypothetical protein
MAANADDYDNTIADHQHLQTPVFLFFIKIILIEGERGLTTNFFIL